MAQMSDIEAKLPISLATKSCIGFKNLLFSTIKLDSILDSRVNLESSLSYAKM